VEEEEEGSLSLLRGERLAPQPREVAHYTSSIQHDVEIAREVVKINLAHVVMLAEQGILDRRTAALILKALSTAEPASLMDESLEDVHMNLERYVAEKAGEEASGWMHLAKSRNDQVAAAIRMKLRLKLIEAGLAAIALRRALLEQCKLHVETLMPGYTHLQRAQPLTLAHHLLAHHDALMRDTQRLKECYTRVNLSPMGAAALAATSFPVNRRRVAELLGFDGLVENTVDAASSRDFVLETLAVASLAMNTLSRLAEEVVLWSTSEFGFLELSDEYASTSSIMPQKKNPVVAEVARARASRVYGDLLSALSMLNSLPFSYNLDLQEVTPHLWNALDILTSTLRVMAGLISSSSFNVERMAEALGDGFANATELANLLVRKGLPFRAAHRVVGFLARRMVEQHRPLSSLKALEVVEAAKELLGQPLSLTDEEVRRVLNPRWAVEACTVEGGPSPSEVRRMLADRFKAAEEDEGFFLQLRRRLEESDEDLLASVKVIESNVEVA